MVSLIWLAAQTQASIATGPYGFYNSEGCDGTGWSYAWPGGGVASQTEAYVSGTSTGCNWTYLSGNYKDDQGDWHYGVGLGWKHYYLNADSYTDAVEANTVANSACNPGGSCPGTHWTYTSYPP